MGARIATNRLKGGEIVRSETDFTITASGGHQQPEAQCARCHGKSTAARGSFELAAATFAREAPSCAYG
jgi:mono/diheme cytochrome c family protein